MARRKLVDRVEVQAVDQRKGSWTFAGTGVVGMEYVYDVTDQNYGSRNRWQFVVRVPSSGGRIEVRPLRVPDLYAVSSLDRRSLTFAPASKRSYRGWFYCPISLADPTGNRSRRVINEALRDELPNWFDQVRARIKPKEIVKATRGTDARSLVLLVRPEDHSQMIRYFFLTKVWVLLEKIQVSEAA